jgi:hypothetical protein
VNTREKKNSDYSDVYEPFCKVSDDSDDRENVAVSDDVDGHVFTAKFLMIQIGTRLLKIF